MKIPSFFPAAASAAAFFAVAAFSDAAQYRQFWLTEAVSGRTVGPIVDGPLTEAHERLLASCYTSCLNLARERGLESVAFCCISTGVFMFPNRRAAEIAVGTVRAWLEETGSGMTVIFNVFKDEDRAIYERLLNPEGL